MSEFLKFLQEKVVFLPSTLPDDHQFRFENPFEELFWQTPFGGRLNVLKFPAEKPKGALLYFHGNAGNLSRWGAIAADFSKFDLDVYVPDYRGYGKSAGPKNEEYLLEDARFCYQKIMQQYGEDSVTVYGRSLGGAFATHIGASFRPARIILEAAFFNLQDMASRWLPYSATEMISPKMSYHFRSDVAISKVSSPLYHFHGTKDLVVPLKSGQKLFDLFEAAKPTLPKKFITIHGGKHDDLSNFELYHKELSRIFNDFI